MKTQICKICNNKFETKHLSNRFCSNECRKINLKNICKKHLNKKRENNILGQEGLDYIICKWCNQKVKRIYGKHIKHNHPNKTSKDYVQEFPTKPLYCLTDKHNTSKNSGKHMKQEKYRIWAAKRMRGEKNINSKYKTDEKTRKQRSPFSKEFYKKRNLSEDDLHIFVKNALKNRICDNTLEYYLKQNFSEEDAKIMLKNRQTTFSLEKCIKKYGEEKGLSIWKDRQEKWLKNYKKTNFSKISQKLFCEIFQKIKNDFNEIYFAILNDDKQIDLTGNNYEYILKLNDKVIKPDFFIKDNNKIIEFDGIYWHKTDIVNKKREVERDKKLYHSGYKVYHVREDDYYKNPIKTIEKCINFIYETNT
jgi:hypothetical protein